MCVSDAHPKGANDWYRLVRKHHGFFGVDADGEVVDGVAHLDATFSPYAPPPVATFAAVNARMLERAERPGEVRTRWRVGEPYDDRAAMAVRLTGRGIAAMPDTPASRDAALTDAGLEVVPASATSEVGPERAPLLAGLASAVLLLVAGIRVATLDVSPVVTVLLGLVVLALSCAGVVLSGRLTAAVTRRQVVASTERPSLAQVASALADGLQQSGLTQRGSDALELEVTADGEHRILLGGVTEEDSAVFATALEAVAPIGSPRYVISRYVTDPPESPTWVLPTKGAMERARRGFRPTGEAWHGVPSVVGANADRVRAFTAGWRRWVGGGRALYTGSPEGAGVLAAQAGTDPFDVTTVMRRQWE